MIQIILSGCNGKMGRVISSIAAHSPDCEIVCGIDMNTAVTNTYPVYSHIGAFQGHADVLIDFSHPSMLESLLEYACKTGTPAVIATTGLTAAQIEALHQASKQVAIFFSANMSLGVNLLMDLVTRAAKILEENFDIEIIEKHHNQKIDAPSGTALAIADAISGALSAPPEYVYDRHSVRKKRGKQEIGMHAVRGGTIVGEHTVLFAGQDECIEIKHQAASKEVFAVGAVRAAKFLCQKQPGMYNMQDLVNE